MHPHEINKKRHFPVCFIIPLHAGSSPRSTIPSEYTWIIIFPLIWHLDTLVSVTAIPITSQDSAVLGAGTLMITGVGLLCRDSSFVSVWTIFVKPGGGHGSWESVRSWHDVVVSAFFVARVC